MNKHTPQESWQRLVALARRAPETPSERGWEAPPGFATRVAALAHGALEAFALHALGAASLLAVGTVLATANPVLQSLHDEIAVVEADVVTDLTE
jgi:hypothetical protein